MVSEILPDLIDEIAMLLRQTDAHPLIERLPELRIEAICDCGDENCSSFATSSEVKVYDTIELPAIEGFLILDINAASQICFIEVLNRPDVKYLIEEYYKAGGE